VIQVGGRHSIHFHYYSGFKKIVAWEGHVGRKRERRNAYSVLVGKLERKILLGTPRRRRIILKWIYKKWDGTHGLDW